MAPRSGALTSDGSIFSCSCLQPEAAPRLSMEVPGFLLAFLLTVLGCLALLRPDPHSWVGLPRTRPGRAARALCPGVPSRPVSPVFCRPQAAPGSPGAWGKAGCRFLSEYSTGNTRGPSPSQYRPEGVTATPGGHITVTGTTILTLYHSPGGLWVGVGVDTHEALALVPGTQLSAHQTSAD